MRPDEYDVCVCGGYSRGGWYATEAIVYTWGGRPVARFFCTQGTGIRRLTENETREVATMRAVAWMGENL